VPKQECKNNRASGDGDKDRFSREFGDGVVLGGAITVTVPESVFET